MTRDFENLDRALEQLLSPTAFSRAYYGSNFLSKTDICLPTTPDNTRRISQLMRVLALRPRRATQLTGAYDHVLRGNTPFPQA